MTRLSGIVLHKVAWLYITLVWFPLNRSVAERRRVSQSVAECRRVSQSVAECRRGRKFPIPATRVAECQKVSQHFRNRFHWSQCAAKHNSCNICKSFALAVVIVHLFYTQGRTGRLSEEKKFVRAWRHLQF